jgi:hypothetical protein
MHKLLVALQFSLVLVIAVALPKPGSIRGFDPQPDPPGTIVGFDPQPDPPHTGSVLIMLGDGSVRN